VIGHVATDESSAPVPARQAGALLLALAGVQVAYVAMLVAGRRMVAGHDALASFSLAHFFLDEAAGSGETALWMPYLTHGTLANWWYLQGAGLGVRVAMLAGTGLAGANSHTVFLAGFLADELVLAVGTWLLAARCMSRLEARLFTVATVLGSSFWLDQPWFNFRLGFALPLLIHLLHRWVETGRWRFALLAGWLFAVQMPGNLPYFPPVITMVIAVYAVAAALAFPRDAIRAARALSFTPGALAAVAGAVASVAAVAALVGHGTGALVSFGPGRLPTGRTPPDVFATYGEHLDLSRWVETIVSVPTSLENTLHLGFASVPLALLAFAVPGHGRRWALVFAAVVANVVLFAQGGPVAALWYRAWPLMSYYRHVGLTAPLARLFLCFLAGLGLEALLVSPRARALRGAAALALAALAAGLAALAGLPDAGTGWLPVAYRDFEAGHLVPRLAAGAAACALLALALASLARPGAHERRHLAWLLVLHAGQLLGWRVDLSLTKTFAMDGAQRAACRLGGAEYAERRAEGLAGNARATAFAGRFGRFTYGASGWTLHAFYRADTCESAFKTDHWLAPLDDLMKAFWGQPVGTPLMPVAGQQPLVRLRMPGHPRAAAVMGVSAPKLAVFRWPRRARTDQDAAAWLADPAGPARALILCARERSERSPVPGTEAAPSARATAATPSEEPVRAALRVTRFSANRLEVDVDAGAGADMWLAYADVWHPFWTARVNGEPVPVVRANLAYKAVRLPAAGRSRVELTCSSPLLVAATAFLGWSALAWAIGVVVVFAGIARERSERILPAGTVAPASTARSAAAWLASLASLASLAALAVWPDPPETWIARLRDPVARQRFRAAEKLEDAGDAGAAALARALEDPDAWIRREAALALAARRRPAIRAIGPLARAIDVSAEPHPAVRSAAAHALGFLAPAQPAAASALLRAASDPDATVRTTAYLALGRLGPRASAALPALRRDLDSPHPGVRQLAARTAGALAAEAAPAVHDLARRLSDPVRTVRLEAAEALTAIGPAASGVLGPVLGLVDDPDPDVHVLAAFAAAIIGPPATAAVPGLVRRLADSEPWTRPPVIRALARIGPGAAAARPALRALAAGRDRGLRGLAAAALSAIDSGRPVELAPAAASGLAPPAR
jgi:HEAT repeat protein